MKKLGYRFKQGNRHLAAKKTSKAWLGKVVLPNRLPAIDFPDIQDLDDFYTVMEDQMMSWTEQWFQQGEASGYAKAVLRLIEQKFGTPEPPIRQQVEQADADQLLTWIDRLAVATRLDEVFASS